MKKKLLWGFFVAKFTYPVLDTLDLVILFSPTVDSTDVGIISKLGSKGSEPPADIY